MFGSLSRPGEPRPPLYQFNFSNSQYAIFPVVPANAGTTVLSKTHAFTFPRRVTPELFIHPSPKEGAGNAGCLSAPAASRGKK
jgi:hypothetical protein